MTGSTQSRLWDGALLCRIAHIFKIPVVLSGQTIGNWKTPFNRFVARHGFRHVKYITLRDETESLEDLREIGLSGSNIFPTHDDALHSEKDESFKAEPEFRKGQYIVINFHKWGMNENTHAVVLSQIHEIVSVIHNQLPKQKLVFIPMLPSDIESYNLYQNTFSSDCLELFKYDYDFRIIRKFISDSYCCITMKHHPIIFSVGESVPVISLNFSDYYEHKNHGALSQYNLSDFSISLSNKDFLEKFSKKLNEIVTNRAAIITKIETAISELDSRRNKFLNLIKPLVG